ncbi:MULTISPECIES: YjcQ family protein [unclassified Breznakia]|uniref:YjcQ family protein n=1 Tax=unclassified Breznakia TaxID=2623764 RepID=UPI002475345D|nr:MULTISPECIES: YjcQ family protein [unclassified Breznakia]MDH6367368.1 putative transcriptional regulator [Breznakia sp. PH1-1]MDH6404484.1 putative transcriptional regulator [Breznakia sp. PF1-11]MDH6412193.1 putative transcriptional regulator [Breznakia sp. PFB1-11]MDH6414535.1 putative transcriptional regulator [Breznakia sp. PFB1-14]MDH6416857.1 putative transcriptional regulator [Breznakia sp. PFB1-4]
MNVNRKKLMYAILYELNNMNTNLDASMFEVNDRLFQEVIGMLVNEGFVTGYTEVTTSTSQYRSFLATMPTIAYRGVIFLDENSTLAKTYKGLKEIRSFLPF